MESLPDDVVKLVFDDVIGSRSMELMSMRLVCREWEVMTSCVVETAYMEEFCDYLCAMRISPTSKVPKRWLLLYVTGGRGSDQLLHTQPRYMCAGCGTLRGALLDNSCCKRQRKKTRAQFTNLAVGATIGTIVLLALTSRQCCYYTER